MVNPRFDLKTIFTGKTNEKSKPKFAFLINYREEVKEELRHETAIIDQSIILSEIRKFYLFNSTFLSIMIFIFSIIVLKMIILFTEIPFKNYVLYIVFKYHISLVRKDYMKIFYKTLLEKTEKTLRKNLANILLHFRNLN